MCVNTGYNRAMAQTTAQSSKLTLTSVRKSVRELGFSLTSSDGEYCLYPVGESRKFAGYYTTDLADVLATAKTWKADLAKYAQFVEELV